MFSEVFSNKTDLKILEDSWKAATSLKLDSNINIGV